jgi:hypothetical protein
VECGLTIVIRTVTVSSTSKEPARKGQAYTIKENEMLSEEARNLRTGDEIYFKELLGNVSLVTFVSGPYAEGSGLRRKNLIVVRTEKQNLALVDIAMANVKPAAPVEGETWYKVGDDRSRYIAGVTDNFVILKGSQGSSNLRAHVLPMDTFLAAYRKSR